MPDLVQKQKQFSLRLVKTRIHYDSICFCSIENRRFEFQSFILSADAAKYISGS